MIPIIFTSNIMLSILAIGSLDEAWHERVKYNGKNFSPLFEVTFNLLIKIVYC